MNRCQWAGEKKLYQDYHDFEWGKPSKGDDRYLFEMLSLEGAQAGLSWYTILSKRENYKKAFDDFNVQKVKDYDEEKIKTLLLNDKIIRNKLKVNSVITNAKAFIEVQKEYGSFSKYIWAFVDDKPIINSYKEISELPVFSPLSEKISKDLKKRGFKFVGPTIIYSFMQAIGMIDDHVNSCFCKK